eukprot:TRINITY_DN34121_c0_g1_i1.p1 TRINITY_DN34121_c0_g1~~TRINITY_DN34121_c0_g1_i1.p1  ORF type:complete len:490 (+),score=141.25 TRINITY_DN34121_c0_g1_i1:71-1540(+)
MVRDSPQYSPVRRRDPPQHSGSAALGAHSCDAAEDAAAGGQKITGLCTLLAVLAVNFPIGCLIGTMALVILPKESEELYGDEASVGLGFFLGLVGVSQLVCPYAGLVSDRSTASCGRRRPFILGGCLVCLLGFGVMSAASYGRLRHLYAAALLLGMVSFNVVVSAQAGLVPDLVADHLHGAASGLAAMLQLSGSVFGFIGIISAEQFDFRIFYPIHAVLLASGCAIACVAASESAQPPAAVQEELTWARVVLAYRINTDGKGPDDDTRFDFMWVFVGRTSYYIAMSVQAFMEFYFRDAIGTADADERRVQLATVVLVAQSTAGLVAYGCARLSDVKGIGRKKLVWVACAITCLVYTGFALVPHAVAGTQARLRAMYTLAAFYGLGNGCYLAVDYALALDCLPDKATAARDLGVWGVAAFIGSAVGPLFWGLLLEFGDLLAGGRANGIDEDTPAGEPAGYDLAGYGAMLGGGCLASIGAGFFVCFIRGAE